jgi:GxxExxY protein
LSAFGHVSRFEKSLAGQSRDFQRKGTRDFQRKGTQSAKKVILCALPLFALFPLRYAMVRSLNTDALNDLSYRVIGAGIAVHRELGPGLDESDYELALSAELDAAGIGHVCQQPIPIIYKEVRLDAGYRIDLLVEGALAIELKSVESIHPVHEAQLLTYLRLAKLKLGLLINFDVPILKEGISRKVMRLEEAGIRFDEPGISGDASPQWFSDDDSTTSRVVGAAIEVHRQLGPGLLKSAYEECLCYELSMASLPFQRSAPLSIRFREIDLPRPAEIDLVIANQVPVMLASVGKSTPLLEARLLGRLRNGGWRRGLLLNFGEKTLAAGLRRIVNPDASQG